MSLTYSVWYWLTNMQHIRRESDVEALPPSEHWHPTGFASYLGPRLQFHGDGIRWHMLATFTKFWRQFTKFWSKFTKFWWKFTKLLCGNFFLVNSFLVNFPVPTKRNQVPMFPNPSFWVHFLVLTKRNRVSMFPQK